MKTPTPRSRFRWWTWAHRATAALFLTVLILGRFDWFPFFKGSAAATRLFEVIRLADPLAALEATLASQQLHTPLVVAAGLLVIVYALVGRAFCGWLCPLGLLLELNDAIRTRIQWFLRRHKRALPNVRFPRHTKYLLLGVFLVLSFVIQLPVFQIVSPINLLARSFIFGPEAGLIVVGAIVTVEYVSRRAWCIALCPLGALYSLLGKFALARITIDQEQEQAAKQCGLCAFYCPMQIEVLKDHIQRGKLTVDDFECTRCGSCMDGCPRGNLRMGVNLPRYRAQLWGAVNVRKH